ncbi:MAG TPA: hypothetical protein VFO55_01565, partial [Gemmatimonadaceae bacterium]|nr:hypothetical protein [Gemmatimonadaceae bacterium]
MQIDRLASATAALGMMAVLAGCGASTQRTTTVESGGEVASAVVTPANNRTIPMGAQITATLDQSLGTATSKVGDTFTATVAHSLMASDGSVVVPAGAKIEGRVTARDDSDHAGDPALIRLAFDRIRFNGTSYPFTAAIVQSSAVQTSEPAGDRTRQIIIGGAVGAVLGGLISGGELDKIAIGGAIGAAAGSIISLGTE